MPNRDDLFPSRWLKASDCDPALMATISRCTTEMVGAGARAERRLVIHFQGDAPKPLICNRTNFDQLVALTGAEDCDDWSGTTIELFAIDVSGPNGPTRGIRVRRPRRGATPASRRTQVPVAPPPRDADPDDDVDFVFGANTGDV